MGLLTKNSMNLDDMAQLVAYVAMMIVGFHEKSSRWPQEDTRTKLVNRWLEQQGHKASFWKLSKLSLVADGVARMLVASNPEVAALMDAEDDVREQFVCDVVSVSRSALLQNDITA